MTAGIFGRVPRLAIIVAVALFATATLTLAATSTPSTPASTEPAARPKPAVLVVPDVRRQAYVFAKGTLEQAGFAWRVEGSVQGYAANVVATQTPEPGARVVGEGMPTIVLRLAKNPSYTQEGTPENESPYAGSAVRLVGAKAAKAQPAQAAAKPAAPAKAAAKPVKPAKKAAATKKAAARTPAFTVAGAPKEPQDEIALPARAKQLSAWLDTHPDKTAANVNRWLFQHNWIVTGARFGWSGGAEALRTLVAADAKVQKLWGVGARSEELARSVLANVEAQSK